MTTASTRTTTSTGQARPSTPDSSSRGDTPPTWLRGELTTAGDRVRPAPPIAEAREVMWVRGPAPLMAEARETRGSGEAGEVNSSPGPVSQVSSRAMVTTWPRARARHPRSVGGDHVITGVNESHF